MYHFQEVDQRRCLQGISEDLDVVFLFEFRLFSVTVPHVKFFYANSHSKLLVLDF